MNWQNDLTKILGTDYPIIQAPMLGVTTPKMVAAISNAGGLGSLPVGGLPPERTVELIRQTKTLTSKPFAVNFFAHDIPEPNLEEVVLMKKFLLQLAAKHQLPLTEADFAPFQFHSYKEQIDIIINENIPIASFTFGIPDDDSVKRMKHKGIILIGTATSTREARLLDHHNIDVITAQGIEAGGHRGSFLDDPLPEIGLISLLTGIIAQTARPIVAAGGICDGPTAAAAFALGAKGIQPGTLFIASDESAAIPSYKEVLLKATDTDSKLTRAFSGRWARGLSNQFMKEVEVSGIVIPEYPIQNSLTTKFRALAQKADNHEMTNLWAGQCAYKAKALPIAAIFSDLIKQIEDVM